MLSSVAHYDVDICLPYTALFAIIWQCMWPYMVLLLLFTAMALCVPIRLSMALCDLVWSCMAFYGLIWSFMADN